MNSPRLPGQCAHCERAVSITLMDSTQLRPFVGSVTPGNEACLQVEIWVCDFCRNPMVKLADYPEARIDPAVGPIQAMVALMKRRPAAHVTELWPRPVPRELHDSVPEPVRSLFREAGLCEAAGAFRGSAGLLRATVEEICRDRQADGKTLYDKIGKLQASGLTTEVVEDLHQARLLGNDSLHTGTTYAPDEVAHVADLVEEAVTLLYVQPAERAEMRRRIRARRTGQLGQPTVPGQAQPQAVTGTT